MSAERRNTYKTPRTYRFTAGQAFELTQAAVLLGITESKLVRILLDKGLKEIYKNRTLYCI
jgi:hypothetical protein